MGKNLKSTILSGWPDGAALLFFGVLSYVLLYPLSNYLGSSTTTEGDSLAHMWVMGWSSHALLNDPANLFNGNIFYPYINTLAYADHMLAQTLQGLPIYLLTGNIVLAHGILTLFSFILSGWGTYLLVKELSGHGIGGLFAGMVFAFASYKIGHLSQLNLLSTQWIPFCFLFLRRMMQQDGPGPWGAQLRRGWPATLAFAVFFVLNALSSFYYFFFMMPLLALYLLFFYAYQKRLPRPAFLLKLGVAALLAVLFIVPTLLPYAAVVAEQAAQRTPRDVENFSANYRFYFGTLSSNLLWGDSLSRLAGTGGERALFPGAFAYLLSALALIGPLALWLRHRLYKGKMASSLVIQNHLSPKGEKSPAPEGVKIQNQERWAFLVLAFFSLLMSFGWTLHLRGWDIPGPYRFFYNFVPGWVAMRAAMRYGVFVLFAVAVLGGLGVAWLAALPRPRWLAERRVGPFAAARLVGGVLTVLLLFGTFWEYRHDVTYINPNILPNPPEVYRWLAEPAQAGVVLELPAPPDPVNPPSIRSYYSLFHRQPYVNGIASYIPPIELEVARLTNAFPSPESLAAFQGIGVRWLVYHLDDENAPLPPAEWQRLEARLNRTPQVKLAKDFAQDKIKVYELAANPWMREAYAGLPAASDVIVSDYRTMQPTLLELFQTMLRRDGHNIYGSERVGFRYLSAPPTGRSAAAGIFVADEDPALYGFDRSEATWSGNGLKFYRRKEKLVAAYEVARDPKLATYQRPSAPLDINIEKDGLKFNGNSVGTGLNLDGEGRLNLLLSSFEPHSIKLNGLKLDLPGGLVRWRSEKLTPGQSVRLEPVPGQTLYFNRAELVAFDPAYPAGLVPLSEGALLNSRTTPNGALIQSNFTAWIPPQAGPQPGSYILTLDIYRKPWGTHPNGHFATYSVALPGQARARNVQFDFDPATRKAVVLVDSAGVDIGAEVFKAAGDGTWTVFVTLRRSNPAQPNDFPLVGLSRLYEFSLEQNKLVELNILPERPQIMLPPLSVK